MPNIRVTCPTCKSELEIDSAFDGQEVECGNCLQVFVAKRPEASGSGRSGGGKIPGAGTSGSGRGKPTRKTSRRRDDDDYDHDRRRDDDDDYYDDDDYSPPPARGGGGGAGDGAATASLVLGIIAIVMACCCWPISLPLSISATITGLIGLKSQNNKGMAVSGLVLGVIALGLAAVILLAGFGNALMNAR